MIEWFKNLSDANKIAIVIPVSITLLGVFVGILKWRFSQKDPTPPQTTFEQNGSGNNINVSGNVNGDILIAGGDIQTGIEENNPQTQEKLDKILKQLKGVIPEDIKVAVENIFMEILKEHDIPQDQWAEKLMEVAKRHQELLDKWQTFESVDPEVDTLRDQAHAAILGGDYDTASRFFGQAIEIDDKAIAAQEENLAKRKVSKSQSLVALAEVSTTNLNFNEAIELYKQALEVLPASQETIQATYLNNLGLLYYTIAKYKQAEPLMVRALAINESSFDKYHPNVAEVLNNLAWLYKTTNRLTEAEPLMERVLAIDESNFDKYHPNVARDLNNLAQLYHDTNRLAEAEPLMERVLAINEANFGKDHPNVATGLNNLAQLYQETNRLTEAEPLMERALAIDESSFGKEHPKVARDLNNLAQLYVAMNRLGEAEPLLERALAIDESSLGKDHPNVAMCLGNLAQLYQKTDRLTEAEPLMERALAIDESSFGKDHPRVARDLNNLAQLYRVTNRLVEAELLSRRHLEIFIDFTRRTGHSHPLLMKAADIYAGLLIEMGDSEGQARGKVVAMAPEIFGVKFEGR